MTKFKVTGYAMVPVEVSIEVDAESHAGAELAAKRKWKRMSPQERGACIVGNSEDHAAVHDFEPNSATPIPHRFA